MLPATKVKKEATLQQIYRYRSQLLYDLYQCEISLRNIFYWFYQSGFDDLHSARLDTVENTDGLHPHVLDEETVCAVYNALNVPMECALEAHCNAISIYSNSVPLQRYKEFMEMDKLKTTYDSTFLIEELLKTPRVSMAKYKVGSRRTSSTRWSKKINQADVFSSAWFIFSIITSIAYNFYKAKLTTLCQLFLFY